MNLLSRMDGLPRVQLAASLRIGSSSRKPLAQPQVRGGRRAEAALLLGRDRRRRAALLPRRPARVLDALQPRAPRDEPQPVLLGLWERRAQALRQAPARVHGVAQREPQLRSLRALPVVKLWIVGRRHRHRAHRDGTQRLDVVRTKAASKVALGTSIRGIR